MVKFCIRLASIEDCTAVLKLVQELADYEKMPNDPTLDIKTFEADGFGEEAFYKCFVAEITDGIPEVKVVVGYALYYFTYSTQEGKTIYMEDLYVTPKHRLQGIGEQLWKAVVKEGLKERCSLTEFCVLGWNTSSIEFYKKKGAFDLTLMEDWHMFRMNKEEMVAFSQTK